MNSPTGMFSILIQSSAIHYINMIEVLAGVVGFVLLRWAVGQVLGRNELARAAKQANAELEQAVEEVGLMVNELRLARQHRTR